MLAPLLETKLYLPVPPRGLVPRPQLRERLDRGAGSKLMLVSAPAGFGKTTLLAEWLADRQPPSRNPRTCGVAVAGPRRQRSRPFWTYVVAALRDVLPEVGASALELLHAPQAVPIEAVPHRARSTTSRDRERPACWCSTTTTSSTRPRSRPAMAFLLDHLPPRAAPGDRQPRRPAAAARPGCAPAVSSSRSAPPTCASPDRGRGLPERRHGSRAHRQQDVAALEDRTEGWIAALQLAALSMQGRDDVAAFIAGLRRRRPLRRRLPGRGGAAPPAGTASASSCCRPRCSSRLYGPAVRCGHRTGRRQGDCSRRSTAPTCSSSRSTTGGSGTATTTCSPTCCGPGWLDEQPERGRRTCTVAPAAGTRTTATRPPPSGTPWPPRTSAERRTSWRWRCPSMLQDRREPELRGWLELLPDDELAVRPVLSNGYAGALLSTGEVEGVERRIRDAERWVETPARAGRDRHHRRRRCRVPPCPCGHRGPPRRPRPGPGRPPGHPDACPPRARAPRRGR